MIDLQSIYLTRQPESHEAGLLAVYSAARAEFEPELVRLRQEKEYLARTMFEVSSGPVTKETSWIKRIFK